MMYNDDLEFLVSETMKDFDSRQLARQPVVPLGAGLVYTIQSTGIIFVLRALEGRNLSELTEQIVDAPQDYPSLRLPLDSDPREVMHYFSCESVEEAKKLKIALANQRFPLEEEHVCNVGDPTFSWWMKKDGPKLQVFFKLSNTLEMSQMTKIGPMGDGKNFYQLISQSLPRLAPVMPIEEFSFNTQALTLVCDEKNPYFLSLIHLLETGELNPLWRKFFPEWSSFASLRRLWIEIQNKAKQSSISIN